MEMMVDNTLEQTTMRKVAIRLVPFLCILYTIAFIDRINVGFAALSMSSDLGLSPAPACSSSATSCSRFQATSSSTVSARAAGSLGS